MKKWLLFTPPLFSLICALAYGVAFRSQWSAADTPTAILVACAALGSAAVVVFRGKNRSPARGIYAGVALAAPLVIFEMIGVVGFDPLWHRVVWGLMTLGILMAYLFDRLFMKERRLRDEKS